MCPPTIHSRVNHKCDFQKCPAYSGQTHLPGDALNNALEVQLTNGIIVIYNIDFYRENSRNQN